MAGRFSEALGKQLFVWAGWVFTVFGAVGSFVLGQANAWIGWLVVGTGVLALTGHALTLHRRCRELEEANTKQTEELREAERKLNEVPLDLVNRIRELIAPHAVRDVAARLASHADYVLRIQRFRAAAPGEVHLRTFFRRDGAFFAVARIAAAALAHLGGKDAFVLVRTADGLRTDCAFMVVHQTDPTHELVHFRLVDSFSDDVRA